MVILSQPAALSPAGNIKDFVISSSEVVRFRLYKGETLLLDNQYQPDASGQITVSIKDVVLSSLSVELPADNIHIQQNIAADFVANISDVNVSFRAVRCGVERWNGDISSFLWGNFLTWQPQLVETRYTQPQWLTYYNASDNQALLKVKFYLKDGSTSVISVGTVAAGECISFNTQFAHIWSLLDADKYGYYDVYVEDGSGVRLSYIQRYVLVDGSENDTLFIFENTLGGLDSVAFTGANTSAPEYTFGNVVYDECNSNAYIERTGAYSQNSGYKTKREALWLRDFFVMPNRYVVKEGTILPIVVDESSVSNSNMEQLHSFEFKYKLSDDSKYQNLARVETLAVPIEIPTPDNLFFLAPRLAEFERTVLADALLLPVQSPHYEKWYTISYGDIKAQFTDIVNVQLKSFAHTHDNLSLINNLSEAEDGSLLYKGEKIGGNSYVGDLSDLQLKIEEFSSWFELRTLANGEKVVYTKHHFASEGEISNGGLSEDLGGSGNFSRLDSWDDYNASAGDVLSASLGYLLKSDITSIQQQLENGLLSSVTVKLGDTAYGSVDGIISLPEYPTIPNAVTETTVSGWGFTKNIGTVTGVKINGSSKKPTNGVVDLGTVLTAHQDLADYATHSQIESYLLPLDDRLTIIESCYLDSITSQMVINALGYTPLASASFTKANIKSTLGIADWALASSKPSYSWSEIASKPTIPSAVTESTVSGWGFTKNTGTVTGVKINGSSKTPTNGVVDLGTVLTAHQSLSAYATQTWVQQQGYLTTLPSHTHDYLPLSGGTMTGCIITPGNDTVVIKPAKNNYDQIGASNCVFWKIYATDFYGTLNGNCTGTAGSVAWDNIIGIPASMPASDVYAWAKASTKPSYSWSEITSKPTIPSAVTETTVSGWGFTKNIGTVTGVKINGTTQTATNGVVDLGTVLTAHQSLSAYATQSWVQQQNYLTSVPGEYITSTELSSTLESYQNKITSSNKLDYSLLKNTPTIPTALKSPYALTFGSKIYDGSAAKTIVASDLGALTAHQSIYALTFSAGVFSAGTFTANSAAKTINIPTHTSHLTNNSGFITSSSIPTTLKNPYALTINNSAGTAQVSYDGSATKSLTLTKAMVGLGNVNNTADSAKNVKYATVAGSVTFSNGQTLSVYNDGTVYLTGNLAVEGEISNGGISDDMAGSSSYTRLDSWDDYSASAGDVLSAVLGYGLKTDIASINANISNLQSQIDALGSNNGGGSVSGDYLPLTGGTITGDLIIKGDNKGVNFQQSNGVHVGELECNGSNLLFRDYTQITAGFGVNTVVTNKNIWQYAISSDGGELYGDLTLYGAAIYAYDSPIACGFLEVQNEATIYGEAYVLNNMYVEGDLTVTGGFNYSDMRYKDVIENICIPNDVIADSPVFRYRWNDRPGSRLYIGTSAQYWGDFDDDFICEDKRNGKLSLNYIGLAVSMGKSNATEIRELKRKIVELETRLAAYEC